MTSRKTKKLEPLKMPVVNNTINIPKFLKAKTNSQKRLIEAIENNDIIVALGVAGVGKTSIAVSVAAKMLYDNKIEKIFITRPVVESGPSIGFLPGNQDEKLSPYLQPLYVELTNVVGNVTKKEWVSEKLIEVKPLSYLRGVTIKNAVMIADEMQNAEFDQLKLLLTRLGEGSKIIITGDVTQSDLPQYKQGGLDKIAKALDGVPRIAIIAMDGAEIVRHPLISTILKRLEGI